MSDYFSIERFIKVSPMIIKYLPVTLKITAIALIASTCIGVLIAAARVYKVPGLSTFLKGYTVFVRGLPYVVLMLLVYYYMPFLAYKLFGIDINGWDKIIFVEITFILHESAYIGEIIRGAIESVPKIQKEAAFSIGYTEAKGFFRIILPQAVKVAIPGYGSNLVELFQNTAITYMIGLTDFIGRANTLGASTGHFLEAYVFVAGVYVIISILIELFFRFLNSRYQFG